MKLKAKKRKVEDFVEQMIDASKKQFPKKCSCCGRVFETF